MNDVFHCDDKDTFVAYLYGEVESDVRREVERHLRTCAACAREADELQAVRHDLQAWLPPEPDLGFTVVPQPLTSAPGATPSTRAGARLYQIPAWAQVAAAALCIGIGLAVANVQVRSTADGILVTTGWATPPAAPAPAPVETASSDEWRRELVALEQSLRQEFSAAQSAQRVALAAPPPRPAESVDTAALLRRMQAMVEASEERQRQEMATKLIQADRMWNMRRQSDLVNFQRSLGNLQNRTFAVQANQQEVINQLRRVSSTPPSQ
jgi:hypothetical protein